MILMRPFQLSMFHDAKGWVALSSKVSVSPLSLESSGKLFHVTSGAIFYVTSRAIKQSTGPSVHPWETQLVLGLHF